MNIYKLRKQADDITTHARDGSIMEYYNGRIHHFGGWNSLEDPFTNSQHYWSEDKGATWDQLLDAPWTRRHDFGHGQKDGKIWIWGADLSFTPPYKDVWTYSDDGGWIQVAEDWGGPGNRTNFGHCIHDGYLYIIGGAYGEDWINDLWRSADGVTWTKVGDLPEDMQNIHTGWACSFKGKLYYGCGGQFGATPNVVNHKVWRSSNGGVSWELAIESAEIFYAPLWSNVAVTTEYIWMIQGTDENNLTQPGFARSADGVTWERFKQSISSRHATAICAVSNEVAVACGNLHNDCYLIKKIASPFNFYD